MIKQRGYLSPRSIAILVILIVVLIVPLGWLRDGAKSKAAERASEVSASQLTATASITTPTANAIAPANTEVNDPNAFGLSWGLMANDKLPTTTRLDELPRRAQRWHHPGARGQLQSLQR